MNTEILTLNELVDLIYKKILIEKTEDNISNLLMKSKELITHIGYNDYKNKDYNYELIELFKNVIILMKLKKCSIK